MSASRCTKYQLSSHIIPFLSFQEECKEESHILYFEAKESKQPSQSHRASQRRHPLGCFQVLCLCAKYSESEDSWQQCKFAARSCEPMTHLTADHSLPWTDSCPSKVPWEYRYYLCQQYSRKLWQCSDDWAKIVS